jgi:8-oxo-dGTP pyrophosphatase MutT (NUDIX family)
MLTSSSSGEEAPLVAATFDPAAQPWVCAGDNLAPIPPSLLVSDSLRAVLREPEVWRMESPLGHDAHYVSQDAAPVLAAVLIPIVGGKEEASIMLTQRTIHLRNHAGQISFPGGCIEPDDANPVAAALREAREETGLSATHVEVLGSMPVYKTRTGFAITPVVALVRPGFSLLPDTSEVARIFEIPLAFLMNPANHRLYQAEMPDGGVRQYYAIPWQEYFVWGATAGILRNIYHLLRRAVARQT